MTIYPELEDQLRYAARQRAEASLPAARSRARLLRRSVPSIASVAVVVAVVAAVLTAAGHHGRTSAMPATSLAQRRAVQRDVRTADRRAETRMVCRTDPATATGAPSRSYRSILGVIRSPGRAVSLPGGLARDLRGVYSFYTRLALSQAGSRYWVVPVAETGPAERSTTPGCEAAAIAVLRSELRNAPARLRSDALQVQQMQFAATRKLDGPGVCLAIEHPSVIEYACAQSASALRQDGLTTSDGLLSGVVPDGVDRVSVRSPRGRHRLARTTTVPVINNVFTTRIRMTSQASDAHTTITWIARDGTTINTVTSAQGAAISSACGGRGHSHISPTRGCS